MRAQVGNSSFECIKIEKKPSPPFFLLWFLSSTHEMLSRSESFGLRRVYESSPHPIHKLILKDWCKEQENHFSSAPYWNQAHLWPLSSPSTQLLEWNRIGLKHTSLFQAISRKANLSMIYQIFREIQRGGESLSLGQTGQLTFPTAPPPHTHTSLWVFFLVWGVLFFIEIEFISGWISKPHIKFFLRHYSLGQMSAGGVW